MLQDEEEKLLSPDENDESIRNARYCKRSLDFFTM